MSVQLFACPVEGCEYESENPMGLKGHVTAKRPYCDEHAALGNDEVRSLLGLSTVCEDTEVVRIPRSPSNIAHLPDDDGRPLCGVRRKEEKSWGKPYPSHRLGHLAGQYRVCHNCRMEDE